MKKKTSSQLKKSNSHKATTLLFTTQQSFWFRLWIGFLIGANATFALMTLFVLLNEKLRILLPVNQGVFFIALGLIDIWFMIKLLRWHKWGLYGTLAITAISLLLNLFWGADIVTAVLYAIIPVSITLAFVIPQWSLYK